MATNIQNGRSSNRRSLTPSIGMPLIKEKPPPDPNMNNPRLLLNRACIYERQLPGDAYITAHVERLQHGYYSNPKVSDQDSDHVDFLAIGFTFHSPRTLSHRFKSANIRVSVRGNREHSSSSHHPYGHPPGNPRFLMHAPHLIYGTVSPETMEWTFSLAGSLGISEMPISASVIPSGSVNGRYRRYEMMRIQGSARTLKSEKGRSFDIEAGEVVWSLEENDLQRSGLPREFTFVMLIHKPASDSRVSFSIDIKPVIATKLGTYPSPLLRLPAFQPLPCRGIDFRREIGQRFEPMGPRGFNFAELASLFDEYIAMPGRKFSRQMQIPPEAPLPENPMQGNYPGQYGSLNPYQQLLQHQNMVLANNGLDLQNCLLQMTLQNLWKNRDQGQGDGQFQTQRGMATQSTNSLEQNPMALNLRLHIDDNAIPSQFPRLAQVTSPQHTQRMPNPRRAQAQDFSRETMKPRSEHVAPVGSSSWRSFRDQTQGYEDRKESCPARLGHVPEGSMREADPPSTVERYRASHERGRFDHARARRNITSMANSPLSASLLSLLSEK